MPINGNVKFEPQIIKKLLVFIEYKEILLQIKISSNIKVNKTIITQNYLFSIMLIKIIF